MGANCTDLHSAKNAVFPGRVTGDSQNLALGETQQSGLSETWQKRKKLIVQTTGRVKETGELSPAGGMEG